MDDLRQLSIEVCLGYELSPLTFTSTLAYEFLDVVSAQDYSCPTSYVERELLLGVAVYNFSRSVPQSNTGFDNSEYCFRTKLCVLTLTVHGLDFFDASSKPYIYLYLYI